MYSLSTPGGSGGFQLDLDDCGVNEVDIGVSLAGYNCGPSISHAGICLPESDNFSFALGEVCGSKVDEITR